VGRFLQWEKEDFQDAETKLHLQAQMLELGSQIEDMREEDLRDLCWELMCRINAGQNALAEGWDADAHRVTNVARLEALRGFVSLRRVMVSPGFYGRDRAVLMEENEYRQRRYNQECAAVLAREEKKTK
jgi:hypothetical protein